MGDTYLCEDCYNTCDKKDRVKKCSKRSDCHNCGTPANAKIKPGAKVITSQRPKEEPRPNHGDIVESKSTSSETTLDEPAIRRNNPTDPNSSSSGRFSVKSKPVVQRTRTYDNEAGKFTKRDVVLKSTVQSQIPGMKDSDGVRQFGHVSAQGFLMDVIDNIDDVDGSAKANGPDAYTYAVAKHGFYGEDTGRVARYGAGAKVTTGEANAKWNLFGAYAEGPHASAEAGASHIPYTPVAEAGAMAEVGLGKAGVKVGPINATVGLNANTGARIGTTGLEVSFLGFGFSIGKKWGISTPIGGIGIGL